MNRITINDPGGIIRDHVLLGQHYAQIGAYLVVKYCASACLMLLAQVPKDHVCFYPGAWIGTHTPAQRQNAQGYCCEESPTTMHWERGKDWIANGYAKCG